MMPGSSPGRVPGQGGQANNGHPHILPGSNPTHVVKYDQKEMASPVVLAKGYDEVAQKIKAIAAEHGIPMVENVQLARALAREVQIGQPIKAKWFKPVAEILAAVYRLRKGAA